MPTTVVEKNRGFIHLEFAITTRLRPIAPSFPPRATGPVLLPSPTRVLSTVDVSSAATALRAPLLSALHHFEASPLPAQAIRLDWLRILAHPSSNPLYGGLSILSSQIWLSSWVSRKLRLPQWRSQMSNPKTTTSTLPARLQSHMAFYPRFGDTYR